MNFAFTTETQRTRRQPKRNKINGAQDLEIAILLNPLNRVSQSFSLCPILVRTMPRLYGERVLWPKGIFLSKEKIPMAELAKKKAAYEDLYSIPENMT